MNNIDWEEIMKHGVLKWNTAEDITDIQEQVISRFLKI